MISLVSLRVGLALLLPVLASASLGQAPAADAKAQPAGQAATSDLAALRKQIENGHADQALVQLDKLAAQTPVQTKVLTLEGVAYYNQDKMQQADRAFAAALDADPGDREAAEDAWPYTLSDG